jgi:hypothetical protein
MILNMSFVESSIIILSIILGGNSRENQRVFKLQKKAIRLMSNVSRNITCREWFKRWKILAVNCVHIMETICYVKENLEKFNQNLNNHNYDTRQRKNLLSYILQN